MSPYIGLCVSGNIWNRNYSWGGQTTAPRMLHYQPTWLYSKGFCSRNCQGPDAPHHRTTASKN